MELISKYCIMTGLGFHLTLTKFKFMHTKCLYMYIYMCIYILYMYIHGKLNTRSWYTYIFYIYILIYNMALNIYTMYVSHGIYIYMHTRAKIRPINRFRRKYIDKTICSQSAT